VQRCDSSGVAQPVVLVKKMRCVGKSADHPCGKAPSANVCSWEGERYAHCCIESREYGNRQKRSSSTTLFHVWPSGE
jgi:hypothetical protein